MQWITTHWQLIALIAGALIQLLNTMTKQFGEYTGFKKVVLIIIDLLSFIQSRNSPPGMLGHCKLPIISLSKPPNGAVKKLPFVGALAVLSLLLSACHTIPTPRHCMHLDGLNKLSATPWTDSDCQKAQTKKLWLTGVAAGIAVASGSTGIGTVFPSDQSNRLAIGIPALALGIAAAVIAPFAVSATKDYADHCVDSSLVRKIEHSPSSQPVKASWLP